MKNYSPNNTETTLTDTSSTAPQLHAEIDDMRRRLVALEARALAHPNPTAGRMGHWHATSKRLVLMIAGVMLIGATIVFGQSAVDSLFVNKEGNVGIGTSAPRARLDVSGGGVKIGATSDVVPAAGKELVLAPLSGTSTGINFQHDGIDSVFLRSDSASRSTSLGGNAGTFLTIDNRNGNVGIGATTPRAKLDVAGTIISQGRYQRDDAPERTYEVSSRYHLSLTAATYGGRTRQIAEQVIKDLCGDQDGCEFRLGMTRGGQDAQTETASLTGLFYYSTSDGRWRTSTLARQGKEAKPGEAIGIDGNNKTEHIANSWDTCYFTDSPYSGYTDQSDPTIGLYLLVWNGFTNPGRTCELTLID